MVKRWILASLLVLLLAMAVPVTAQGPVTPEHSDPVWQASYWNNVSLSGTPALTREEANIDHNWGTGSPKPGIVSADNFSARWTRYIDVAPGTYRFTTVSDDGIRVWVDSDLVLNVWTEHPARTDTADVYLSEGHHLVKVEYFEKGGDAVAQVQWQLKSDPQPITEWRGEYYNNLTLSGDPAVVRNDAAINFSWGAGSPAPNVVTNDYFSARWTRNINFPAGRYTFSLTIDDGARLWVNGHLLVDAWFDGAARTYSDDLYLPGGPVTVEVQYYERTGAATAKLTWSGGGTPPPTPTPPPSGSVIVDDRDAGFVKGGSFTGWRTAAEGYEGHLTWTYNNASVQYNYNWARWYPDLQARNYEVFVYIPHRYTTTAQARYWVRHADGFTLRVVNQSAYHGGQWVSLGTYRFSGADSEYVSLADVTYEPYATRLVAFDAVKWVPR